MLLNIDANAKTVKGRKRGYMTAVLYLAPFTASGFNLCPTAEKAGCWQGCLNTAGRGGMAPNNATFTTDSGVKLPDNAIQRARLRRTALYLSDPVAFMAQLESEIVRFLAKAEKAGLVPVVRLNGTSDIRWENVPCGLHPHIFARFPKLRFYDYTKIPNRRVAGIRNYHLTFSYSHRPEYAPLVLKAMSHYGASVNFAVVFGGTAPRHFLGRRVIDGDASDLRFLDKAGVVVALTAKGRAKRDTSGFVVRAAA